MSLNELWEGASHGGGRIGANDCGGGPRGRFRGCGAPDSDVLPDVGMAPSVLMRGDFIEIPSPFNALTPDAGARSSAQLGE